ncbi:MAG: SRPBCC family protein [Candidatus Omnitrophica bacterium]|nr:SRPBCC family protein [Candidatus Omnitrophota bacterium]
MPFIRVATTIRREKGVVYQTLKQLDKFPSFLKDVKEVRIRSSDGNKIVSNWKVDIDGTPIEWTQENILDRDKVHFRMIEGDYERYEGIWTLEENESGTTRVELHAEFKWGVPGLERFVGSTLEKLAVRSLKGMLWAIRRELQRK